ncbi:MAG: type II toxin-antitoxin system PrlF family antitoxin [Micrococcaceae bacterium]
MTRVVESKITSKNQITVPKPIRTALNVKEHDFIEFVLNDDDQVIVKRKDADDFNSFWDKVFDQEKKYGNPSTDELDWGADVGAEVID